MHNNKKKNCFNYEQTLGTFFLTSVFEIKAKTLNSKKQLNEQTLSNLNNHSLGLPKGPFTNYVYKRREVGGQKNRLFKTFIQ